MATLNDFGAKMHCVSYALSYGGLMLPDCVVIKSSEQTADGVESEAVDIVDGYVDGVLSDRHPERPATF